MRFYKIACTLILMFFAYIGMAQDVLINSTGGTPDASAVLEVESTSKGVLIPRVTTTQMNTISSPATGLLVFNSTNGSFYFYNGSAWIDLSEDNLGDHTATQNVELNDNYLSNDGGNEGIRIDNSGNVGIGTSAPSTILQVEQDGEPQVLVNPKSTTGQDAAITVRGARNASTSGVHAQLNFENYDNDISVSNKLGRIAGVVTDATTNVGDLAFYSFSDGITATESMRISRTGDVGIGITSPTALLHLNEAPPASAASGQLQIDESTTGNSMMLGRTETYGFVQTQNTEPLSLNPLGNNVGIGIADPVRNFHVNGSSGTSYTQMTNSTSGSTNTDGFLIGQNGVNTLLYNYENGFMQFRTDNTNRMRITNTGYIGIGTTSPSHFLHISDDADAEIYLEADADNVTETDNPMVRFRQDGSSVGMNVGFDETNFGSNSFGIGRRWSSTDQTPSIVVEANTGDVGINKTNPTVELDVSGDVNVSGKTTTASLKVTGGSPASDKVLVSDGDGDATWQDVPSKTHSISMPAITYSDDVLQSGTTFGTYGWNYRYVQLSDGGNKDMALSLQLPTGRTSNTITMHVSYTSDVNAGNFRLFFATTPRTDGETIGSNPSGSTSTLTAPATANTLETWTRTFNVGSNDTYLFMIFRRSGADALDTSTGNLRILGVTFDYQQ